MEDKAVFNFAGLPDIPVFIKGGCNLFYENDSLFVSAFRISKKNIFVPTKKKWPVGDTVNFTIRILDEIRTYYADGVIEAHVPCPTGIFDSGMLIKFVEVNPGKMGIRRRVRQFFRVQKVVNKITLGALKYAMAEARGNRLTSKDLGEPHAGFREPVLLIQGWFGTRGVFSILENRLKREGFPVFSFHLGAFNIKDIAKSAELIATKLEKICLENKIDRVNIIGHSMGGLIGLFALKNYDISLKVNKFIAIGTPFHGTPASYLGIAVSGFVAKSVWQMTPNSPFIKSLHNDPMPEDVDIYSIISRHDILAPEKYSVLRGAKNLVVTSGHAALIINEEVYRVVSSILSNRNPLD